MELTNYKASVFGEPITTGGRHGYVAYLPSPIPREIALEPSTVGLLADAEAALGRLAGAARLVANPHLLIAPALRREALSSTRIEGTQASLPELLRVEAGGQRINPDIEEVVNYIEAAELGVRLLDELPISKRMIREIHAQLLDGVRGAERNPGEFRRTQNWIGPAGATIESAMFVPPPDDVVDGLLDDWERYANEPVETPTLIRCALLHYQLETIHPFLDGNGRLGRLIVVLYLIAVGRLPSPVLYLSSYLESRRDEYYRSLQLVRERGEIDAFLRLFLTGLEVQATDAVDRAELLTDLRERYRQTASTNYRGAAVQLAELVVEAPILTAAFVERRLDVTRPTAHKALRDLEHVGILKKEPSSGQQIVWVAGEVLDAVGDNPSTIQMPRSDAGPG